MARIATSKVVGLKEARAALQKLPGNVQHRVMRKAVRAGAAVMRSEIRAAAPVSETQSKMSRKYGRIKDNIRIIRLRRDVPDSSVAYRVNTGGAPHAYWYEYGTKKQIARPFFRPAVDQAWQQAVTRIRERLASGVEREARNLAKATRL